MKEKRNQSQKLIKKFQNTLGDTEVFLLELKTKRGISKANQREINEIVSEIQKMIIDLPKIAESPNFLEMVSGIAKRAYDVWRRIFR